MAANDLPDDPNPALRAELTEAVSIITPQIDGLTDMGAIARLSQEARSQVAPILADRVRRRDLERAVLTALDSAVTAIKNLKADGYPALDPLPVLPDTYGELQNELATLEAALKQFQSGTAETGDFNPQSATRS